MLAGHRPAGIRDIGGRHARGGEESVGPVRFAIVINNIDFQYFIRRLHLCRATIN